MHRSQIPATARDICAQASCSGQKKKQKRSTPAAQKSLSDTRAASREGTAKGTLQRCLLLDFSLNTFKLITKRHISSWPQVHTSLAEMPPVCHRNPQPHALHAAGSNTPPNEPPEEQKPSSRSRSKGIQSKSRESNFSLVLKTTNTTGQAGEGCCLCRDPTSCSRISPGYSSCRTLKRKLPPRDRHRGGYIAEKMSSSSWVTQTLHKVRKLHSCQEIFSKLLSVPRKPVLDLSLAGA